MGKLEIALGALIGIGLLLVAMSFLTWYGAPALAKTSENYQKFASAELADKCKTPPGYSDADWRQHMGHHPDQYKECLK